MGTRQVQEYRLMTNWQLVRQIKTTTYCYNSQKEWLLSDLSKLFAEEDITVFVQRKNKQCHETIQIDRELRSDSPSEVFKIPFSTIQADD